MNDLNELFSKEMSSALKNRKGNITRYEVDVLVYMCEKIMTGEYNDIRSYCSVLDSEVDEVTFTVKLTEKDILKKMPKVIHNE